MLPKAVVNLEKPLTAARKHERLLSEDSAFLTYTNIDFRIESSKGQGPSAFSFPRARNTQHSIENDIITNPSLYANLITLVNMTKYELIDDYKDEYILLEIRKTCVRIAFAIRDSAGFITTNPLFEVFIICVILINTVVLAMEDPNVNYTSGPFFSLEYFFLYTYTIECALKITANGLMFEKDTYLRNSWNILDFIIVLTSWIATYLNGIKLGALRSLRILRPLRGISSVKGIKLIMTSLLSSIQPLFHSLIILFAFLLLFAIAGLQLWMGLFKHTCLSLNTGVSGKICGVLNCPEEHVCASSLENPNQNTLSFDNVLVAFVYVFQVITLEGWTNIMGYCQKTFSYFSFVYFLPLVFIGSFLILNLAIAIITTKFSEVLGKNAKKPEKPLKSLRTRDLFKYMSKRSMIFAEENSGKGVTEKEMFEKAPLIPENEISLVGHWYSDKILVPQKEQELGLRESAYIAKSTSAIVHPGVRSFATELQWRYSGMYIDFIQGEIRSTDIYQMQDIQFDFEGNSTNKGLKIKVLDEAQVNSDSGEDINQENEKKICEAFINDRSYLEEIQQEYKTKYNYSTVFLCFNRKCMNKKKSEAFFQLVPNVHEFLKCGREPFKDSNGELSSLQDLKPGCLIDISFNIDPAVKGILGIIVKIRCFTLAFLNNDLVNTAIILLVISNVICLSLDYYGASADSLKTLDQINTFFTFLFFSELILKLFSQGLVDYCRNSMNLLDFIVVVLSLTEFFFMSGNGSFNAFRVIRILRIFRILRVLKIFRYLTALAEIIRIISDSLSEFFYLFCLLLLFVVISALLGMQIFGGNFNFPEGLPRNNFDSFHWAVVTSFQLLSEENWDVVLTSSMRYHPASSIFLLCWVIIGNFVLLNILLAIMLQGFDQASDDEHDLVEVPITNRLFKTITGKTRQKKIEEILMLEIEEEEEEYSENMDMSDLERILRKKSQMRSQRGMDEISCERSFYVFSKRNKFRRWLYQICMNPKFESFILALIFANSLKLVFDTYILNSSSDSTEVQVSEALDIVFTIMFTLESLMKSTSFGFWRDDGSYLSDSWNILDFSIVLLSLLDISLASINIPMIKVLRVLRTLRPLRLITHNISIKIVVSALISSLFAIVNVLGIIALIWLVFAILGVSLFAGKLYSCTNPQFTLESDCKSQGFTWEKYFYNYDNILEAMSSLFTISSQEAWPDRMFEGVDAVDIGVAPQINANPFAAYYFVAYVIIGNFFLVNLFTAVVYDRFNQARKVERSAVSYLLTRDQLNWLELQELIVKSRPRVLISKQKPKHMPESIVKVITGKPFDTFMIFVIILNTTSMAIIYDQAPDQYISILNTINDVCTYIFIAEAVLKIAALEWSYFFSYWNQFDFFVVLCSVLNIIVDHVTSHNVAILRVAPQIIRIIRVLRVSRMFRVFKSLKSIQVMLNIIVYSFPAMLNVLSLMLLVFFMYSILGSYMFYQVNTGQVIDEYNNFSNFHSSMLILWRISTGENYPYIISDCVMFLGSRVYILYFTSFVSITSFVLLDLFVSVIIQNYQEYQEDHGSAVYIFDNSISHFKKIWNQHTLEWKGQRISHKDLIKLMIDLGPDLGVPEGLQLASVIKVLASMDLEADANGYVYYNDMLFAVMKRKYGRKLLQTKDKIEKKLLRKEEIQIHQKLAKVRLEFIKKLNRETRIGDRTVSRLRIFMGSVNLKPHFNAWREFVVGKMGKSSNWIDQSLDDEQGEEEQVEEGQAEEEQAEEEQAKEVLEERRKSVESEEDNALMNGDLSNCQLLD